MSTRNVKKGRAKYLEMDLHVRRWWEIYGWWCLWSSEQNKKEKKGRTYPKTEEKKTFPPWRLQLILPKGFSNCPHGRISHLQGEVRTEGAGTRLASDFSTRPRTVQHLHSCEEKSGPELITIQPVLQELKTTVSNMLECREQSTAEPF